MENSRPRVVQRGELIGEILVPESPANLALGGSDLKTLYLTARKSLYAIPVGVKGIC